MVPPGYFRYNARSASAVTTKVSSMEEIIAAIAATEVGAPGRCVNRDKGSSGDDCVGKCSAITW